MKKEILGTFLGLILLFGGLGILIFYMRGMSSGASILLLLLGVILMSVSVYVLYRAGTVDTSKMHFKELIVPDKENVLDKNNEILSEWNKTAESRDKLKVLEAAAVAEEGK